MERHQRINSNAMGNDTMVRNQKMNLFGKNSYQTFYMTPGHVSLIQPEPLFKQGMVSVKLSKGGSVTSAAYPNAFIEPITGNMHGLHEGLMPNQMVMLGFAEGNSQAPFIVNRYPYQAIGNPALDLAYFNPMTKKGWNSQDTILGHFSGSFLRFSTLLPLPGSTQLYSMTDLDIETQTFLNIKSAIKTEIESPIIKLTGSTHIELNGNTNFVIKYTEMKSAFDTLKTDLNNLIIAYNAHVHSGVTTGGGSSGPTPTQGTSSTADMAPSKNDKVLL